MAFTSIPKDLSRVKSKLAFNMTKRQLICFGIAVVIGVPVYFLTRGTISNSGAVLLMMVLMLPFFMLAMYERDGQPAEVVLRNYIRAKWFWPSTRPYKTHNLYEQLEKEVNTIATRTPTQNKATRKATKTPFRKRKAGKWKQGRC